MTLSSRRLTEDEFNKQFPVDIKESKEFVVREIRQAIDKGNTEELELAISLIWLSGTDERFIDILNELLINPNHWSHQSITKQIQSIKNPSSVPFIRKVLQSNFDYLAYCGSDSHAIAKWFSWALYDIGTKEAIDLMRIFKFR